MTCRITHTLYQQMARMNVPVLQIILVKLVLLTIDIYECDFSEFGTQYSLSFRGY